MLVRIPSIIAVLLICLQPGIVWCLENDCEDEEVDAGNGEGPEEEAGEEEKKVVGQRLIELVSANQSIADSAIEWLQDIDTGYKTRFACHC